MSDEPITDAPTADDVAGHVHGETSGPPGIRTRVVGEDADDVAGHLHERSNDEVFGIRTRVEGADEDDDVEGHIRTR